jgi:hypothetical protein
MARTISGVYRKTDEPSSQQPVALRVLYADRSPIPRVRTLELRLGEMRFSSVDPPPLGSKVLVGITLSDRFIELEVPGVVISEYGMEFGVKLEYLSARQAYGVALAIDLNRAAAKGSDRAAGG